MEKISYFITSLIIIVVIASTSFAIMIENLADVNVTEDLDCQDQGDYYLCYSLSYMKIEGTIQEGIECVSQNTNITCYDDCSYYADACFAIVKLTKPSNIVITEKDIGKIDESLQIKNTNKTILPGKEILLMLSPLDIDFSKCSKEEEENLTFFKCPYEGKEVIAEGLTLKGDSLLVSFFKEKSKNYNTIIIALVIFVITLLIIKKIKNKQQFKHKTKTRRRRVR